MLIFYVYYFALITIGSTFFIVMSESITFMHIAMGATVWVICLECYVLCYLVDAFKDVVSNKEIKTIKIIS